MESGHRHRHQTSFMVPVVAISGAGVSVVMYVVLDRPFVDLEALAFLIPIGGFVAGVVAAAFTDNKTSFYGLLALAVLSAAASILMTPGLLPVHVCVLSVAVIWLGLIEPFPLNLLETVALVLAVAALRLRHAVIGTTEQWLSYHLALFLPSCIVAVTVSLVVKNRERVIDLTTSRDQLTQSVIELARANTEYQDYAVGAREEATENERRRITRDIHDIVGYTLTNNMMLMEAALELMKENALALPVVIETARSNAEDGLREVRAAMYRLRDRENPLPTGLSAVARLCRVFEQATGTDIRCNFGNMPQSVSENVDSAMYHVVQESLVNSFRHGGATSVDVQFHMEPGQVTFEISDNGKAGDEITEGIGLSGMRERLTALGGSIRAGSTGYGFAVRAIIPCEAPANEKSEAHPDR